MLGFSNSSTIRVLLPLDPFSLVRVESFKFVGSVDDSPVRTDSTDDGEDTFQDLSLPEISRENRKTGWTPTHENPSPTPRCDQSADSDHSTDCERE